MRPFVVLAVLLALAPGPRARADEPPPEPPAAPPAPFPEQAAFLGLCGAEVREAWDPNDWRKTDHVRMLQGMGVAWVETLPVRWDEVDAQPPTSPVARYDWKRIDDTLSAWQHAGFAAILVISPASSWASQAPETTDWARFAKERLPAADAALAVRGGTGAAPPKPEYWKDWQRFVRDLVERYDGDGKQDDPGLVRPLRQIQILDQVQRATRWLGSAEEYLRLLHHAREGVDQAGGRCEVIHAAVDLRGLFRATDERPDHWKNRLTAEVPATPSVMRLEIERGVGLVLRSLEMTRLFDGMPHVGSGSIVEDTVNLAALRGLLQARSATNVGMWLSQSPTRRLSRARVRLPDDRVESATDELYRHVLMKAARERQARESVRAPDYVRAPEGVEFQWLRRGTAFDLVRGAARARVAGATRVLTYAPTDERPRVPGEDQPDVRDQGFVRPDPPMLPRSLAHTPSWYAARQMNRLLLGHRSANEAPLGAAGTSVLFLFPEGATHQWVALLLPDLGTWAGEPGKPLPTRAARVPLPDGEVDVEEIALDDAPPKSRRLRVVEGMLALDLSPAPVYVTPVGAR